MAGTGKYRNKLDQEVSHVKTLQIVVMCCAVIIAYLMALYWDAKEEQIFRIPPDLRQGAVMRANDIAPATVFSFSYYILQQLNNWPEAGEKDFPERIYYLQAFLTPGFRETLKAELERKTRDGELRRRVRKIQEVYGRGYEEDRVRIDGNGSWTLWIDIEISETIMGKPVKSVYVQYPLRIVRYDVDPESNPWGLAIDAYASDPIKLTNDDIKGPFKRG